MSAAGEEEEDDGDEGMPPAAGGGGGAAAEVEGTRWGYFRLVAVVPARREALDAEEPIGVLRKSGR